MVFESTLSIPFFSTIPFFNFIRALLLYVQGSVVKVRTGSTSDKHVEQGMGAVSVGVEQGLNAVQILHVFAYPGLT